MARLDLMTEGVRKHLETLPAKPQSRIHPGDTAADHHGLLVDSNNPRMQRF